MTDIQTHADTPMPLRVARIHDVAQGIRSFELVQPDGSELPPFTPGAHVKVQTPGGALRKYSLCNDPAERDRYVITVKRDDAGQGGSISMARRRGASKVTLPVEFRLEKPALGGPPFFPFYADERDGGSGVAPAS